MTGLAYAAVATPVQVAQARSSFRAAFLFIANWHFVGSQADYFAINLDKSPVLHYWSLSVEEQFYLLWPIALGVILTAARRFNAGHRVVAGAVLVLTAASLALAASLRTSDPARAYFGTDARMYQLLLGAMLALLPGIVRRAARWPRACGLIAMVGGVLLVVTASSLMAVGPIPRGGLAAGLTVVLLVALEANPSSVVAGFLGHPRMAYLGQISYGTYLWHWPVIVLVRERYELGPGGQLAVAAAVATGLAALSSALLEIPIRNSRLLDRHPAGVIGSALCVTITLGLVLPPRLHGSDDRGVRTGTMASLGYTPVPADFDQEAIFAARFGKAPDCYDRPTSGCTIRRGSGRHILLMGDSNAEMLIGAFLEVAELHDLTLSVAVAEGCHWQRGVYTYSTELQENCRRRKEDTYRRLVPELDPDVVILVNGRESRNPYIADFNAADDLDRLLKRSTLASIDRLAAGRRQVVVIEPIPFAPLGLNPLDCLARAEVVEQCRFTAPAPGPQWLEQIERDVARRRPDVHTLDIDRLVCPMLPICDPIVRGRVVWWDSGHLTGRFALALAPDLDRLLSAQGIIG